MIKLPFTLLAFLFLLSSNSFSAGIVEIVETPQADASLAIEYYERGQIQDATIVYQRLIKSYPLLPEPYLNLALIKAEIKQYGQGITLVNSILKHYPKYQPALVMKRRIQGMNTAEKNRIHKTKLLQALEAKRIQLKRLQDQKQKLLQEKQRLLKEQKKTPIPEL